MMAVYSPDPPGSGFRVTSVSFIREIYYFPVKIYEAARLPWLLLQDALAGTLLPILPYGG